MYVWCALLVLCMLYRDRSTNCVFRLSNVKVVVQMYVLSVDIGDGIWGSICGVIGSGLGIAAGCMEDRSIFKALYIAHSTLVSI